MRENSQGCNENTFGKVKAVALKRKLPFTFIIYDFSIFDFKRFEQNQS